jgi:SHS2 domain-containing protein
VAAQRYELFDHTADVGVRVRATSLAELLAPATDGLYAIIGDLVTDGREAESRELELSADEPALLLRDYLAEVLGLFEMGRLMVTTVEAREFSQTRLAATVQLQRIDMTASTLEREVKAVTYHELRVCRVADGYEATYIVDI